MSKPESGDIPQLFEQFDGNAAGYQEVMRETRADGARLRWPLLLAVSNGDAALDALPDEDDPAIFALPAPVDEPDGTLIFVQPAVRNAHHLAIEARYRARLAREAQAALPQPSAPASPVAADARKEPYLPPVADIDAPAMLRVLPRIAVVEAPVVAGAVPTAQEITVPTDAFAQDVPAAELPVETAPARSTLPVPEQAVVPVATTLAPAQPTAPSPTDATPIVAAQPKTAPLADVFSALENEQADAPPARHAGLRSLFARLDGSERSGGADSKNDLFQRLLRS